MMMSKPIRVLVTDGGYKHTLGAIRSLAQSGYEVDAIGSKFCLSRFTRYLNRVSYAHDKFNNEKLADFVELLKRERYDVLLPVGARSVRFVSRHREMIQEYTRIAIPHEDAIELCLNKDDTYRLASSLGVKIPKSWIYNSIDELEANINDISFPVIIKGKSEIVKNPPRYSHDADQLLEMVSIWSKGLMPNVLPFPIIQQYIDGIGEGFFALYQNGLCKRIFMHRRIREVPPSGGVSCCAMSIYEDDLLDTGKKILDSLNWHGVAMVEFKRERSTGHLYLMEINPKYWGSLDLALESGVDFPSLNVKMAMGDDIPFSNKYNVGVRYHWPLEGDLQHVISNPRAFYSVLRDCLDPSVKSNIKYHDILPALFSICCFIYSFLKNFLNYTGFSKLIGRIKEIGFWMTFVRYFSEITGIPLIKYCKINDFLYVGSQHGAVGKYILKKNGITSILNLRKEFDDEVNRLTLEDYCCIPIIEFTSPKIEQIWYGIEFIEKSIRKGRKVYIHCSEGISRAPTMALAYLIDLGMTLDQSIIYLTKIRPFIKILPIQLETLKIFEQIVIKNRLDNEYTN